MDYGKLAYLKAEDLEAKIAARSYRATASQTTLALDTMLASRQALPLFAVGLDGTAGLIIHIKTDSPEVSNGTQDTNAYLLLDGKIVCEQPLDSHMVFMLSLESAARIAFAADCGVRVRSVQAMLLGEAEFTPQAGSKSMVAINDEAVGLLTISDGEISISISRDIENPTFSASLLLGFGTAADIAAINYGGEECFAVCYRDEQGNVFLSIIALSEQEKPVRKHTSRLPVEAASLSLSSAGGRLFLGFVKDGTAYVCAQDGDDLIFGGLHEAGTADSIVLVKSSMPPVAILGHKGSNFLRICENEISCLEILNILAEIDAE